MVHDEAGLWWPIFGGRSVDSLGLKAARSPEDVFDDLELEAGPPDQFVDVDVVATAAARLEELVSEDLQVAADELLADLLFGDLFVRDGERDH